MKSPRLVTILQIGTALATILSAVLLVVALPTVFDSKAGIDAQNQSDTISACRAEYGAVVTGARTLLDDASANQDTLVNATLRAFIAEDTTALKALVPALKQVSGVIDRANRTALDANGLYQKLLRAQRQDPGLFTAMCKTGPQA